MSVLAAGKPSPLRERGFTALMLGSVGVFFSFALLVSVVPLWVVHNGAGEIAAGASTGVFMAATVLAQLVMTRLVRRFGYRAMSVAGAVLLGVPAPFLLLCTTWEPVIVLSFVRGLGFGFITVCGSALVAELLGPESHGRGAGLYGMAVGLPLLLGLPASTWLAAHVGFGTVFFAGAVLPLLGIVPLLMMPRVDAVASGSKTAGSMRGVWRPWLPMLAGSVAFGAMVTFVPLMLDATAASLALLLMSATALGTRWLVGVLGDRGTGHGRWLFAGSAVVGLALAAFAAAEAVDVSVAGVIAAAVYGAGFGAVQNESLVIMFRRVSAARASVAWNVAFDAGQGLGAIAVGAIVASISYTAAFATLAVAALLLLPVTWSETARR